MLKIFSSTPFGEQRFSWTGTTYGLENEQHIKVVPARFDEIVQMKNGFFKTYSNRQCGLINPQGVEILEPYFDDIYEFKNGFAKARKGCGTFTYINSFGLPVNAKFYSALTDVKNDVFYARSLDKKTWSVVRTDGRVLADGIVANNSCDLLDYDLNNKLALFGASWYDNDLDQSYAYSELYDGNNHKIANSNYFEDIKQFLSYIFYNEMHVKSLLAYPNFKKLVELTKQGRKDSFQAQINKATSADEVNNLMSTLRTEIEYLNSLIPIAEQALRQAKINQNNLNNAKQSAYDDIMKL